MGVRVRECDVYGMTFVSQIRTETVPGLEQIQAFVID